MTTAHWIEMTITALISSIMGGVLGGLVAWGGIRIRLDHVEQKVLSLSSTVVYKDVCEQCRYASANQRHQVNEDIREIKRDVKRLLVEARDKTNSI
jgi:hypothetical protein